MKKEEKILFPFKINSWQDWGKVYQNIGKFYNLIEEIFNRHGILVFEISSLTPGTHGVFLVNDKFVIKILAPKESGIDPVEEWKRELFGLVLAEEQKIPSPKILFKGEYQDQYLFYYLVLEYLPGRDAGKVLKKYGNIEKEKFVKNFKNYIKKLHVFTESPAVKVDLAKQIEENTRWKKLSLSLQKKAIEIAKRQEDGYVFVHGDLTGENIRIVSPDEIYFLDYADGLVAPLKYEWGPMIIELFSFDEVLMKGYFGEGFEEEGLIKEIAEGILIHDFGPDLLEKACVLVNEKVGEMKTVKDVEKVLLKNMKKA